MDGETTHTIPDPAASDRRAGEQSRETSSKPTSGARARRAERATPLRLVAQGDGPADGMAAAASDARMREIERRLTDGTYHSRAMMTEVARRILASGDL